MLDNETESSAHHEWVLVGEATDSMHAELLRGLLEAQGISAVLVSMEGIGRLYGFYVGPLARAQVLVPGDEVERAARILQDYYAGAYEQTELEGLQDGDQATGDQEDEDPQPEG